MYAIVTGASSGIGEEYARILARNRYDLILVARRKDKLKQLSEELKSAHGVEIEVMDMDLTVMKNVTDLFNKIKKKKLDVEVLVNNAGFGANTIFSETEFDQYNAMIKLNITSLTQMTHGFIEYIEGSSHSGYVQNVASVAGLAPVPYMSVYGATKAYVVSFTQALSAEYDRAKLSFNALCPGMTISEFHEIAGSKVDDSPVPMMTSAEVAQFGYENLKSNKTILVPGFANKFTAFLGRVLPKPIVLKITKMMMERLR